MLACDEALESDLHPGRGNAPRSQYHTHGDRSNVMQAYLNDDTTCVKTYRFTYEQLTDIALEATAKFVLFDQRSHKLSHLEHVSICIERCVQPNQAEEIIAKKYDISKAEVSVVLSRDIPVLIDATRLEIAPMPKPDLISMIVKRIGIFPFARLMVDTTDHSIQRLPNGYNAHHKQWTVKSLIIAAENGTIFAVETGFGGAEADNTIFLNSGIMYQV